MQKDHLDKLKCTQGSDELFDCALNDKTVSTKNIQAGINLQVKI